jgi:ADP-heptose:LPS heptosyltransferase
MGLKNIKFDCRYFKGEIPCVPNKLRNKICNSCDEYEKISKRILIIKLGAIGDVIRTTPLVTAFRNLYPGCHITWITLSPEILPTDGIDQILRFDFNSVYGLLHRPFDIAINLDKEIEACSLLFDVFATEKYGFTRNSNHIDIATPAAEHKLMSGFFDQLSKTNTKSYTEEIFEICHLKFKGEPYLMRINDVLVNKWKSVHENAGGKLVIGLNTGCGKRWSTRLWPASYWLELIRLLQKNHFYPVVLGGPDEDAQNKMYAAETGCYYPGTYSLEEFIAISANCDVIVSAVSMMMHIAVGLQKPLVLFNNIFNKHEFDLYGRGKIVEPAKGCDCYYGNTCKREKHCMESLPVSEVFSAIEELSIVKK